MTQEEYAALPLYSVVKAGNWIMVKTNEDNWAPAGWETFWASNKEMATETYYNSQKLYFSDPEVVALGVKS